MSYDNSFTKEKLDLYLKELAKAFRKYNGKKMPAEIILVGGATILTNYGFRDMTTDIDAIIHSFFYPSSYILSFILSFTSSCLQPSYNFFVKR